MRKTMKLQNLIFAALLLLAPMLHGDDSSTDDPTATAIEVSGTVIYEVSSGVFKPVVLGQLFASGDHVMTKDDSGLHLVLADGSSIVLGPNTEMTLDTIGAGDPGSQTFLQLLKGTANAIVQKLKDGSVFEMHTPNAVAAVKGTEFEVSDDGSAGAVSVHEGVVAMSDAGGNNVVKIPALQRASASPGHVEQPIHMSDREIQNYEHHWAHARSMHSQREGIMRRFGGPMRARQEAALRARRPALLRRRMQQRAMHRNMIARHNQMERKFRGSEESNHRHGAQEPKRRDDTLRPSERNKSSHAARKRPKKRNDKKSN
jgi:hypothetical protein